MLGLAFPAAAAGLSAEQRRYLDAHGPITMCVDPDWAPFEIINGRGEHEGIAGDLVRLAAAKAGATLRLVKTRDWDESIDFSKSGKCEILSFLNQSPKRDEWLVFTDPIFSDPNVFITREEHGPIGDPAALTGESIAFPKGTAMEERIRRDYPNLRVIDTESEAEAIALVSERKADMTMRSLIVAAHTIKTEGLFNLKIAGKLPDFANRLRIGVRREAPVLRDILNVGVTAISEAERNEIVNRHVSIKIQAAVDNRLIYAAMAGVLAAILAAGAWTWWMRCKNKALERLSETDVLTGLHNRKKIETEFFREFARSRRYKRPFSVMVLDIDHFKKINDDFGHVMGDKVIVQISRLAAASIRHADFIGRWGGEEFLLLCPETPLLEASVVAERVRQAVAAAGYDTGRSHSVSIGVAEMRDDDSEEGLLKRADAALYQAKNAGRNRVCAA